MMCIFQPTLLVLKEDLILTDCDSGRSQLNIWKW